VLAADVVRTDKRVAALRKYMDREVLSAGGFARARFAECRRSARKERLIFAGRGLAARAYLLRLLRGFSRIEGEWSV
jgi:hypothetical protein